jgi:hypothetical protein
LSLHCCIQAITSSGSTLLLLLLLLLLLRSCKVWSTLQ